MSVKLSKPTQGIKSSFPCLMVLGQCIGLRVRSCRQGRRLSCNNCFIKLSPHCNFSEQRKMGLKHSVDLCVCFWITIRLSSIYLFCILYNSSFIQQVKKWNFLLFCCNSSSLVFLFHFFSILHWELNIHWKPRPLLIKSN